MTYIELISQQFVAIYLTLGGPSCDAYCALPIRAENAQITFFAIFDPAEILAAQDFISFSAARWLLEQLAPVSAVSAASTALISSPMYRLYADTPLGSAVWTPAISCVGWSYPASTWNCSISTHESKRGSWYIYLPPPLDEHPSAMLRRLWPVLDYAADGEELAQPKEPLQAGHCVAALPYRQERVLCLVRNLATLLDDAATFPSAASASNEPCRDGRDAELPRA